MRRHELTDEEWAIIQPLLPRQSRGVPGVDDRRVINGILWRFRTGAPWRDVPERYGPRATLCNRFVRWRAAGVWDRILDAVSEACDGDIMMIDRSCVRADIQPRSIRKGSFAFSSWVCRQRNPVERFLNRLKQFRGLATHHHRSPETFLAAFRLAASRIWLATK